MESKLHLLATEPYLSPLKEVVKAPTSVYIAGKLPPVRVPSVAIVGTRRPTSYGKEVTYRLAYDLAKRGVVIISGLALGVDAIAHQAALDARGTTIAVLGNGLDHIYPSRNQQLGKQIVKKGGALLSEYPPSMPALAHHFLARNRLVSGLADAVIVTEAAARSGTLSTVNHALEQGKEVFVVPGNITSLLSVGSNRLLKQGAHPILTASDVLEVIAPHLIKEATEPPTGNTPAETTILQLIHSGVRGGDQLQEASGLKASEFSQALTMLEINGDICALGGNQWTIR